MPSKVMTASEPFSTSVTSWKWKVFFANFGTTEQLSKNKSKLRTSVVPKKAALLNCEPKPSNTKPTPSLPRVSMSHGPARSKNSTKPTNENQKNLSPKSRRIKKGNVGGIQIRSSNLGVILDNSSSMQPHIPELRKEINSGFPGSHFREIYGCSLTWRAGPTTLAMEDLIIVKQTDALYWFSDLRDPQAEAGLVHLGELLQRSGALFYVASVDQKPENELEDLITEFKKK